MGVIRHYLTIDGKNSLDFNTWISGGGTFNSPSRDIDKVTIPGRNGELIIDNGRYANIEVNYDAFITKDFDKNISALRAYMGALRGYKVLQDTYDPEHFRLANFSSGLSVETTARNLAGKFTLTFDCKPQRYLIKGNQTIEDVTGQLLNPTLYDALPIIRAYGTGSFSINGVSVTISTANVYTDIDCERMEAYKGTINCNANINAPVFPKLAPGLNTITTNMRLDITPRWWEL